MEKQPKPHFIEIQHPADWAIQATANSPESLFKFCAEGMFSLLKVEPEQKSQEIKIQIELNAVDLESLLVAFLSEILFYYETEEMIFPEMNLSIEQNKLSGILTGRKIAAPGEEIKAVTYHQMRIEQSPQGLSVIVVFDV